MKKLLVVIGALALTVGSYAMTAEEAAQSKNFYTIEEYCESNKVHAVDYLFKKVNLEKEEYVEIYNTITNKHRHAIYYPINFIRKFSNGSNDKETFDFAVKNLYSLDKIDIKYMYNNMRHVNSIWAFKNIFNGSSFVVKVVFPDFMRVCTDKIAKIKVCLKFYSVSKDRKYLDMIDFDQLMVNQQYSVALEYAIVAKDVDKMIDVLCVIPDVTASEADAIIEPINAVEANYRKDDILLGLENINSRCTIKLYDDQKTWEPILAKIRAMISLRK